MITYRSPSTSMGMLNPSLLVICNGCGAYVAIEDQHKHTTWHTKIGA